VTRRASIVGASGYTGGELLRLLLGRPRIEVAQAASRSLLGQPLHATHPNLRAHTDLVYTSPDEVEPCDVLFLAMPHGRASERIDHWTDLAPLVIDLSSDFRLRDPSAHERVSGRAHAAPGWLDRSVYGLPEISRDRLAGARLVSGVGCNATAMILALLPLARAGLIERVVADIKVGSSEGGAEASPASHHPERSGSVRTYSPSGHRHGAEVIQALGEMDLDVTVTAIEMVRGVLCTAHVLPTERLTTRDLWRLYRTAYAEEPFVRLVASRSGLHRLPDPKILAGSNHADVGFALDEASGRIVALCAIDNLVKGAAGSAVQSMNIALGLEEDAGLAFPGLHPI